MVTPRVHLAAGSALSLSLTLCIYIYIYTYVFVSFSRIWGSNPTLGGLRVSPFQVSGGIGTLQSRCLQPTEQHAGHSIWTNKTPPSQTIIVAEGIGVISTCHRRNESGMLRVKACNKAVDKVALSKR